MGAVASAAKVVIGPIAHAVGGVIKDAAGEAGKAAVQAGANALTGNNNAAAAPKTLLAAPPGAAGAGAPKALLAAPPGHPDTKPQVVAPVDAGKKLTAGLQAIAAAKAKEESDENTTATNFLKHSLDMLKAATLQQCNILIVTDNEHDEWWPKGQKPDQHLPGMPDIEVDVGGGKKRKYAVYCFETGSYIRRGKTTPDQWIKWGETKEQFEKATGSTHVWFNEPKPKKDPNEIEKLKDEHDKKTGVAAGAAGKKPAAKKPAKKEESEGEEGHEGGEGEEEEEE